MSRGVTPLTLHICESVFRKSSNENVVVSLSEDDTEQHPFRIDACGRAYSVCPNIPYLSECVVLCRLFPIGSYHNLQEDKRKSAPHFLCMHLIKSQGADGYALFAWTTHTLNSPHCQITLSPLLTNSHQASYLINRTTLV